VNEFKNIELLKFPETLEECLVRSQVHADLVIEKYKGNLEKRTAHISVTHG